MNKLIHYRLCPASRAIRVALNELGIDAELAEESAQAWRAEFLALNPAGELPVLVVADGPTICGAYAISEWLDEDIRVRRAELPAVTLFPGSAEQRAEVRRVVDWFLGKMNREVTRELLQERIYSRLAPAAQPPDADILRAVRANLRYHLSYVGHLAQARKWLGGDDFSFADISAAAHLASADYLGEVPWDDFEPAKSWYARVKSRRTFRPILGDRLPGLPPPEYYSDLDF